MTYDAVCVRLYRYCEAYVRAILRDVRGDVCIAIEDLVLLTGGVAVGSFATVLTLS